MKRKKGIKRYIGIIGEKWEKIRNWWGKTALA